MIERNSAFNTFEVTCDRCSSETAEFDCDNGWAAMIDELRAEGWAIRKDDDGDWEHIGPACVEAERGGVV